MTSRRPSVGPVIVLALAALVPALGLAALQQAAASRSQSADAADAVSLDPVADLTAVVAGGRRVMTTRRAGAELSGRANHAALAASLSSVTGAMASSSCLSVTVDGATVDVGSAAPAIPASTVKVLIAVAAIEVLGTGHRFTTTVVGPSPVGGIVPGDIVLVGGGDPLLGGDWYPASYLERHPVMFQTSLDELARTLAASGVQAVDGRVLGDPGRYDLEFYVPDWAGGIAGIEAGPYAGLMANDSRVEGDAYRWDDPIAAAAEEFSRRLSAVGISNAGGGGRSDGDGSAMVLASIESAPLRDIVAEMLMTSDNNTAELLLKEIDYASGGEGTRLGGIEATRATLAGLGVPVDGLGLVDGSGLANNAMVRCETLVAALDRGDPTVIDGLAVAGVSGTLSDVFVGSPLEGRLQAKTGTLGNPPYDQDPPAVKALAGRYVSDGGERITFALLLNQFMINDQANYRPIWDDLASALAAYPSGPSLETLGP